MRTFDPIQQISAGKYRILSVVLHGKNNLLVVSRGKKLQLVTIPTEILTVNVSSVAALISNGDFYLLEIKEGAGYKVPLVRRTSEAEVGEIDFDTSPEGAVRRASGVEMS